MAEELYKLPFPSSGLSGVSFCKLMGRTCSLLLNDGENIPVRIVFEGVEAYQATYYRACTLEMIKAYDKVCDVGRTKWLTEVQSQLERYDKSATELHHLRIYFDDGPCYEFICKAFHIERQSLAD